MNAIDITPRIKTSNSCPKVAGELENERYSFGNYIDDFDGQLGEDWEEFASTWDDLGSDTFMADNGNYRKRRFSMAVYDGKSSQLSYKKHQGYFQEKGDNPLNGGVDRIFDPVTPFIASHGIIRNLILRYSSIFSALGYSDMWDLQIHQVRINTKQDEAGQPSPEGIHKDGTDFTTLVMVNRNGVVGGENKLFDNQKKLLASKVLENQGDFVILNDKQLYHDVSAIKPIGESGFRDMLMIGFTQR